MKHAAIRLAFALSLCPALALAPAANGATADAQGEHSTRDLYLTLIRQARDDGHARAAIAFLDDFDRSYPGETDAQILRINCLLDLDQTTAAQEAAVKLPTRKPSGAVHTARGHVFAALGNWDEAIGEYSAALQTIPSDTLTINALGYAQIRSGRADAAIETLKRARELAPQDSVVRNNLLLALAVTGRTQEGDTLLAGDGSKTTQADLRRQVTGEATRLAGLSANKEPQP